jgi:hypothetical protein
MRSIIILFVVLFSFSNVTSQIPQNLTIQGVFVDKNGKLLDGEHFVTSSVFYQENGGNSIYTQRDTIKIHSGGLYLISLGKNQSDFQNISFSKPLYIQLDLDNVSSNVRIPLSTTPYSFMALKVSDSSITEANLDSNLIKKINDSYTPSSGKYIGEMKYWNGRSWESIVKGSDGDNLTLCNGGIPRWGPCPEKAIITISYRYISKNEIAISFNIKDFIGHDSLIEAGICFGKKSGSNISDYDSIIKLQPTLPNNMTFSFKLTSTDVKNYTFFRAYAINGAGDSYSDEKQYIALSHSISDSILSVVPEWYYYNSKNNVVYYKLYDKDTFELKSIYSCNGNRNKNSLIYKYKAKKIFNDSPNPTYPILGYFSIGNELHLYDFASLDGRDLQVRKLSFISADSVRLKSERALKVNSFNRYFNLFDFQNNDLYLLGSLSDYSSGAIDDIGLLEKIVDGSTVEIVSNIDNIITYSAPYYGSDLGMLMFDNKVIIYEDFDYNSGNWPQLKSYDMKGQIINQIDICNYGLRYPLIRSNSQDGFYLIIYTSWKTEIYKYDSNLKFIKSYNFPIISDVTFNLKSAFISEENGFIRLFTLSDLDDGRRLLSFDIYN